MQLCIQLVERALCGPRCPLIGGQHSAPQHAEVDGRYARKRIDLVAIHDKNRERVRLGAQDVDMILQGFWRWGWDSKLKPSASDPWLIILMSSTPARTRGSPPSTQVVELAVPEAHNATNGVGGVTRHGLGRAAEVLVVEDRTRSHRIAVHPDLGCSATLTNDANRHQLNKIKFTAVPIGFIARCTRRSRRSLERLHL